MSGCKLSNEDLINYVKDGFSVKEIGDKYNYKSLFNLKTRIKSLGLKENYKCNLCGSSKNLKKQKNKKGEVIITNICISCAKNLGITLTNKRVGDAPYKNKEIFYQEYILKKRSPYELCALWKAKVSTIKKYLDLFGFEEKHKCINCGSIDNLTPTSGQNTFMYEKYCSVCKNKIFSKARKNFYSNKHKEISKDILYNLHVVKKLNLKQIVNELKVSMKTLKILFKKYDLQEIKRCNFCGEDNLDKLYLLKNRKINICHDCFDKKTLTKHNFYSKISQEFFWDLYKLLPNELKNSVCFKELNKEKRIFVDEESRKFFKIKNKNFYLDFYLDCLGIPVVIEFNGDLYHGNPNKYFWYDTPNPFTEETAWDIWERDEARSDYLTLLDYYIIYVWEDDYHKNKDSCLDFCLQQILLLYNSKKYI